MGKEEEEEEHEHVSLLRNPGCPAHLQARQEGAGGDEVEGGKEKTQRGVGGGRQGSRRRDEAVCVYVPVKRARASPRSPPSKTRARCGGWAGRTASFADRAGRAPSRVVDLLTRSHDRCCDRRTAAPRHGMAPSCFFLFFKAPLRCSTRCSSAGAMCQPQRRRSTRAYWRDATRGSRAHCAEVAARPGRGQRRLGAGVQRWRRRSSRGGRGGGPAAEKIRLPQRQSSSLTQTHTPAKSGS